MVGPENLFDRPLHEARSRSSDSPDQAVSSDHLPSAFSFRWVMHLFPEAASRGGQTVLVGGVDANGALVVVLEEPEVGVVGRGHAGDAGTGADEAGADVDRVRVAGLHVHRGERRERAWRRLVVPGRLGPRAAAWVVAGEEEGAAAFVRELGRLELRLQGEDEFERAVGVGTRGRHVEAEDGRNVVGREDAVVLWAKGLVRLCLGDLRDVVREFELAGRQLSWAPAAFAQGSFAQHFSWVGDGEADEGEGGEGFHLDALVVTRLEVLDAMRSDKNQR